MATKAPRLKVSKGADSIYHFIGIDFGFKTCTDFFRYDILKT
jgi:hypothetical protein